MSNSARMVAAGGMAVVTVVLMFGVILFWHTEFMPWLAIGSAVSAAVCAELLPDGKETTKGKDGAK